MHSSTLCQPANSSTDEPPDSVETPAPIEAVTLVLPASHLLRRGEAALLLDVHPLTVYRWGKNGILRQVADDEGNFKYPFGSVSLLKSMLGASHRLTPEQQKELIAANAPAEVSS